MRFGGLQEEEEEHEVGDGGAVQGFKEGQCISVNDIAAQEHDSLLPSPCNSRMPFLIVKRATTPLSPPSQAQTRPIRVRGRFGGFRTGNA